MYQVLAPFERLTLQVLTYRKHLNCGASLSAQALCFRSPGGPGPITVERAQGNVTGQETSKLH